MLSLAPFLLLVLAVVLTIMALSATRERGRITLIEGRRLLETGQTAEALSVFDRLARRAKSAPGREAALFYLGQTLEALERHDAARRVYLRYLADYELASDGPRPTPEVHERVRGALAELLQRDAPAPEGAWERFRREGQPAPVADEPPLPLSGIRALMEAGRFQAALAQLVRHVSQPPDAPGREAALHLLGLCYEGLGRPEQARTVYRRYMREYGEAGARRSSTRILLQVAERMRALEPAGTSGAWERFKGELQRIKDQLLPEEERPGAAASDEAQPGAAAARQDPAAARRDQGYLDRGLRVGDYVLADKLGDGGFGEVFRALRPVAIKFARDPEAVEHLRRFAEVQGRLSSPRIVRPLEVNLEAEPPYVAMEFVDGPTLRDLLRQRQRVPAAAALAIMLEVARGLQDAHRAGALHLDLKPENVLLDRAGLVKLTDFELGADAAGQSQDELALSLSFRTRSAHLAGTLVYMSPEQRAGRQPDARSDLFTFGVMLFEALTGTLPEPGDRPSDFVPGLPAPVDQVFERCFARLERRYASVDELVRELEAAQQRVGERVDLRALLADVERRAPPDAIPRALARLTAAAEALPEPAPPPVDEPSAPLSDPLVVPPELAQAVAEAALGESGPELTAVDPPPSELVAPPTAAPPPVEGAIESPAPLAPQPPAAARPPLESLLPTSEAGPEPARRPPLEELLAARSEAVAAEEESAPEAGPSEVDPPRRLPALDG